MNDDFKSREKELEQWLKSTEAAIVHNSFGQDPLRLPGEETISDRVVSRLASTFPSRRIKRLETGLRRWRLATVAASAACVMLAVVYFFDSNYPGAKTGAVFESKAEPVIVDREKRKAGFDGISVSRLGDKLGNTRKKLADLSSRSRFDISRKGRMLRPSTGTQLN
jgi:hypothetical protein